MKSRFRIVRALYNSLEGLKALWLEEQAFRSEVYFSLVLTPCIAFINVPSLIKLVLVLLWLLVLVVESLNSAFEIAMDRISLEIHPQTKMVKDIGSAAVGITLVMNIIAWGYAIYLTL